MPDLAIAQESQRRAAENTPRCDLKQTSGSGRIYASPLRTTHIGLSRESSQTGSIKVIKKSGRARISSYGE